jgi:hypothetical protein
MKQTNIHVIENNHANFLESTNDFNLRILMLMSQSMKENRNDVSTNTSFFFYSKPQSIVATNQAKFAKTN